MLPLKRILVPVDFSECSRAALRYAAYFASTFHPEVDLLHVYYVPKTAGRKVIVEIPGEGRMSLEQLAEREAELDLRAFLDDPRTPDVESLETHLVAGHPYKCILEKAGEGHYDLIVIGTHGRTGVSRLLLGSVAERVVRHAPCPVLTVGHREPEPPESHED